MVISKRAPGDLVPLCRALGSMASGEVSWDDEKDVKEIIADVRDVECDMAWCVLLPLLVLVSLGCARAPTREASRASRCVSTHYR